MRKSLVTVLDVPRSFTTLTHSRLMIYDNCGCLAPFTIMVTLFGTLGFSLADTLICMCGITLVELALACYLRAESMGLGDGIQAYGRNFALSRLGSSSELRLRDGIVSNQSTWLLYFEHVSFLLQVRDLHIECF